VVGERRSLVDTGLDAAALLAGLDAELVASVFISANTVDVD
jgi:hypothetical protein